MSLPIRTFLTALGQPQPATPIKTENSTATGFVYDNIRQRRTKTWDMRYYWLRCRMNQKQFDIFWDTGANNHADYWTKHWPTSYHQTIRPTYVLKGNSIQLEINFMTKDNLRGCVENSLFQT